MAAVVVLASCSDANEYKDARTDNPSWVKNWNDTLNVPHPESVANSTWLRGSRMKVNAMGEEIQGFIESVKFEADSVAIKMSEGVTAGTWTDESNTPSNPLYEYTYSPVTARWKFSNRLSMKKARYQNLPYSQVLPLSMATDRY